MKNLGFYNAAVDGASAQSTGILAGILGTEEAAALVDKCYVNGTVTSELAGAAVGALAGSTFEATVSNVYTNAAVSAKGTHAGDFIGTGSETLTVLNSYSAGKANGSQAARAFGDTEGDTENFLFYDGENRQAICSAASKWEGWHEDGTVGLGWPLLQWQVERGDHARLCGFGIQGDLNQDGKVDIADAVTVLNIMAAGTNDTSADLNQDGKVDIADFVTVLNIMAEQ